MIFGAGQNGRLVLDALRQAGLTPVAFVDETPAKIGTAIDGLPVIGVAEAAARDRAIAVCSIFSPSADYLDIATRLGERGLASAPLFAFLRALAPERLPFYFLDRPERLVAAEAEIAWLAERLVDRASADLLCAQIEFRLSLRYEALPPWSAPRAPPPAAWPSFAVIDAGAFDGDTLLPLMAAHGERVSAALALEPDPTTFARLERNIAAAGPAVAGKTRALRVAVDAASGRRAFASVGNQGSGFDDAGDPVETASIDDLVEAYLAGERRLYIKFDVEGAEASAIDGAARTIVAKQPVLAVSAYHRPEDLWSLARRIGALDDRYRYRLQSHGADGADLMLYALPPFGA
jgi:FkbM family methyltransferase